MKKMAAVLAAMLLLCGGALAEGLKMEGSIEAARTQTLAAPYSGIVGDYDVRVGDELAAGETLFEIRSTPVYADFDGEATGVFAQPGDGAAYVQERYGALCYLEREQIYQAECTTSGADSGNENRIIHAGETVYIRSTASNERKGKARVIGVMGKAYTLEVLEEKDIRVGEQVKVYRDGDFGSSSCIGTGRVDRVDPTAVTAEGYVLSVHVSEGQTVRRGDLLFETVPDRLDGLAGGDGSVVMPQDGVVLSLTAKSGVRVSKDEPMAVYCPKDAVQLVCAVDEEDLAQVETGAKTTVKLDAYPEEPISGTIVKIARVNVQEGSGVRYHVTIELEKNEHVRIGMSATAEL